MIDKIKYTLQELGFNVNINHRFLLATLKKDDASYYEVYANFAINKYEFGKMTFAETINLCSDLKDLNILYEAILNEFKFELRKNKLNKLLNGRIENIGV